MIVIDSYIILNVLPRETVIGLFAVLTAIATIFVITKYKKLPEVKYLICVMVFAAIWAFTYGMEFTAGNIEKKIIWSKLSYLGIAFLPLSYFLFATTFSRKFKIITHRNIILLAALPLITILLVFTNEYHHLVWAEVRMDAINNMILYRYGIIFWLFWFYSVGLIFSGLFNLIQSINEFTAFYKSQVLILLIATFIPLIGNILYVTGLNPFPGFDWTPVLFVFSGLVITNGVIRYGMFDLVPFARKKLIDTINDGVIVINPHGYIEDHNPAINHIFKFGKSLIRKKFSDIFTEYGQLVTAIEKKNLNQIYFEINRNDDKHFYYARITPVVDKKNILSGHLIQIHDITSIKKREEKIKKTNKELRIEIQNRNKLINDLDAFAHTIAHDLHNSLGSIYSSSQLMEENISDMDADLLSELSGLIKQSAQKAIHITQELLLLATVTNEKIEKQPLDMNEIFSEAKNRLHELINEYNAQINSPSSWPIAIGYAPWIEEVWVNYLSNAIKYGGTPPIIEVGADIPVNNMVKFWIKDNGSGLSEEELPKMFKKYARLAPEKAHGYGLGLSIVKRIIEKLGGRVGVESTSRLGEGTKFWFELTSKNNT